MIVFNKEKSAPPQQGGQVNARKSVKRFWDAIEGRYVEEKINSKSLQWGAAIGLLVIALIYNTYRGMFQVRHLANLNRELTELKIEHMTISTELMNSRRLSTIEDRLAAEGVQIEVSKTAPILIK